MHDRPRRWMLGLVRSALVVAVLAVAALAWGLAHPDGVLELRVQSALARGGISTRGAEIAVHQGAVRLQGFVRSEAERSRMTEIVRAVEGVERVQARLYVTAWPTRPVVEPQLALLAASSE